MRLPVNNAVLTSDYGKRILLGQEQFHNGLDFISRETNTVFAITDGEVIHDFDNYEHSKRWTDRSHSAGNYIIICHTFPSGSYYCRYLHLGGNIISKNEKIKEGQILGKYGDYGFSFGAHVHVDFFDLVWQNISPYDIAGMDELVKGARI